MPSTSPCLIPWVKASYREPRLLEALAEASGGLPNVVDKRAGY